MPAEESSSKRQVTRSFRRRSQFNDRLYSLFITAAVDARRRSTTSAVFHLESINIPARGSGTTVTLLWGRGGGRRRRERGAGRGRGESREEEEKGQEEVKEEGKTEEEEEKAHARRAALFYAGTRGSPDVRAKFVERRRFASGIGNTSASCLRRGAK